ncbi:thermonuclease family protein [Bartonella sp. DGB1]|uniref:thermonuclease family protein n=1 Tax=Bartonella sp. DGB1 TaxID=3239807 RepID=UPI0035240AB6
MPYFIILYDVFMLPYRFKANKYRFLHFFKYRILILAILLLSISISWFEDRLHPYLPARFATIQGYAKITDGDGLNIAGQEIRLWGIDAPEALQKCYKSKKLTKPAACGIIAINTLKNLINKKPVRCFAKKDNKNNIYDKYNRLLAVCYVDSTNINKRMVELGWAVSYGAYENSEKLAREKQLGLWKYGYFIEPKKWRMKNRHQ